MTAEFKIDQSLRCSCGALACDDQFAGEYGEDGYCCAACVRALNAAAMEQARLERAPA